MNMSLNRRQAEDLIRRVDDRLQQERRKLLKLDTPLTVLVPPHLKGLPTPGVVGYISERLLFALASFPEYTSLRSTRLWLDACLDYLFHYCLPVERTFYYLLKLTQLPRSTRDPLFEKSLSDDHPFRRDEAMPKPLEGLEVVCVMALSRVGKLNDKPEET